MFDMTDSRKKRGCTTGTSELGTWANKQKKRRTVPSPVPGKALAHPQVWRTVTQTNILNFKM